MFTIFQLSDPHFGTQLIPESGNIINGFNAHDERIWTALRGHLLSRIKNVKDNYIVAITGDLSQLGNIKSYRLARSLIFKNDDSDISKKYGLQLEDDKVFIVPGNHDSYDQSYFKKNNLRTFNNIFYPTVESSDTYPRFRKIEANGASYIFMGIDSTYKKNWASPRKKFGKGKVTKTQLDQLTGRLKEAGEGNFRVLCLHHCPIIVDKKRDRSLMIDHSQKLLSWICKHNINVVLCGHLHEDFYDILPLRRLISYLPTKWGLGRIKRNFFKETHLNSFHPITIAGKKVRYMDSIAYHHIRQNYSDILDYEKGEFETVSQFNSYLHNKPEYQLFINDFSDFGKKEIGIMMAGSACQEECRRNSYLEIGIVDDYSKMRIIRHKYSKRTKGFFSKEREIKLNNV